MILALLPLALAPLPALEGETLPEARAGFRTHLVLDQRQNVDLETPPAELFQLVEYDAPNGPTKAYLSTFDAGRPRPAIVWITGGFPTARGGSYVWNPGSPGNEQSASAFRDAGMIMLFPTVRGTARNPGQQELMMGEVDDVLAAADFLAGVKGVDPERIYLGGHSTGGTLALLVAESTDRFEAVFSFGPESDFERYGVEDEWPFDKEDPREWRLRSPRHFLDGIKSPTHVIEGRFGNRGGFELLEGATENPRVAFHMIEGADHFKPLQAINEHLAARIVDGGRGAPEIEGDELQGAFDRFWAAQRQDRDAELMREAIAKGHVKGELCRLSWTLRTSVEERAREAAERLGGETEILAPDGDEQPLFRVVHSRTMRFAEKEIRAGSEAVAEVAGALWLQDVGWTAARFF